MILKIVSVFNIPFGINWNIATPPPRYSHTPIQLMEHINKLEATIIHQRAEQLHVYPKKPQSQLGYRDRMKKFKHMPQGKIYSLYKLKL